MQEILSQITPELNKTTNSPMLSRDSSQYDHDIARHAQAIADIKKCYNLQMLGILQI
ncbi:hypothetical protein Rh054_00325 [Rickettsia conorii subsp. heilongjiangensis 054]|nr:hypothetical protein Rh054_00325 [Rickettsia conorii subsp. heilongjiangensis 054]